MRDGWLKDAPKIGTAADQILRDSGLGRCFATTIRDGYFAWDFDVTLDYEERLLAGRYVITTSLDEQTASTADVVVTTRCSQTSSNASV